MALGIIGSLIGGVLQASAANKAAKAQEAAAKEQVELARETRDLTRSDLRPFYGSGVDAQNVLAYELGLANSPGEFGRMKIERVGGGLNPAIPGGATSTGGGPTFNNPTAPSVSGGVNVLGGGGGQWKVGDRTFADRQSAATYLGNQRRSERRQHRGFKETPGYRYRLRSGINALDASAAAGGNLYSGAQMKALNRFGQDHAASEYDNYLARLSAMSGGGQNAAAGMGAANNVFSGIATNAIGARGNAQAAGAIGQGNAFTGMIDNITGYMTMQNFLQPSAGMGATGASPWITSTGQPMWV